MAAICELLKWLQIIMLWLLAAGAGRWQVMMNRLLFGSHLARALRVDAAVVAPVVTNDVSLLGEIEHLHRTRNFF